MSFRDLLTSVLGEKVVSYPKEGPTESYTSVCLFGRGGSFDREPISPYPDDYQPSQPSQALGASTQYSSPALQPQQKDPFQFPLNDKPSIPQEYHQTLSGFENADIIASVIAQETGGYGYQVPDPETGQIVDWPTAQEKGIRGASGEVGLAQIIPKWHFKAAGFPDEESYAQALYDPQFSLQEASRIINHAISVYDGDLKKALNTYNKAPSYPDEIMARIGRPIQ